MTDTQRRPFNHGTIVGWDGQRVTIAGWSVDDPMHINVRLPNGRYRKVSLGELHESPGLTTQQATTIIIRYSSDDLVPFPEDWEGLDRDATVREYEASLARELESRYGGLVQVIDTPQMGLCATSIELIPCPEDPRQIEDQIQSDMEFHYIRAGFWHAADTPDPAATGAHFANPQAIFDS